MRRILSHAASTATIRQWVYYTPISLLVIVCVTNTLSAQLLHAVHLLLFDFQRLIIHIAQA